MILRSYKWAIILVGLVLGIMLAAQYRVTREIQANEVVQRAQELSTQIEKLKIDRDSFQKQVDELRSQLDEVTAGPQVSEIKEALEHARIEAGVSEVSGQEFHSGPTQLVFPICNYTNQVRLVHKNL
jgi:uncharacterized protein YlxW (UPF0749 family)